MAAVAGLSSAMRSGGAGGGRKPSSGLGLWWWGSFPSFRARTECRARKEPRDAVSCWDTSRRQEHPCPSGKSWQSRAWEQKVEGGVMWRGGRTPGHGPPPPIPWWRMGHLPAPRALLGLGGLRRTGVLYGGEV